MIGNPADTKVDLSKLVKQVHVDKHNCTKCDCYKNCVDIIKHDNKAVIKCLFFGNLKSSKATSNIQSIDKRLWYDTKQVLEHKISQIDGFLTPTIRRIDNYIEVSGQITFRFSDDCEIYIWNTCKKYSGNCVSLNDLIEIQRIVKEWYEEELG